MDIADIGGDNEVLLYWVSPAEQADAATVVFWSVNQSTLTDISSCAGPPIIIIYLLPMHCMPVLNYSNLNRTQKLTFRKI